MEIFTYFKYDSSPISVMVINSDTRQPIRNRTLLELRAFIRNKRNPALYNIFGAIRGPDNYGNTRATDESKYKALTKAIRSYIGLTDRNCSGNTIEDTSVAELEVLIEMVDNRATNGNGSHYIQHLYYALEAIGRDNLLAFAKKKLIF